MKIKLHFTLSGKTKYLRPQNYGLEYTNKDILGNVKDLVSGYFGNRALVVVNENRLTDDSVSYPEYYAAGWFIDEQEKSELVILTHGDTMKDANRLIIEHTKTLSWGKVSAVI